MSRKSPKQKVRTQIGVKDYVTPPNVFVPIRSREESGNPYWRWGDDNLFPYALAAMSRCSVAHRRIINDKADYISGEGFSTDDSVPELQQFVERVNGDDETLRQVLNKLAFDKSLFGNAFLEIVTNADHSFLSLYHQDASKCRVSKNSKYVLLHHDWTAFTQTDARSLPLFPAFERKEDGTLRSMVHYKDYEPMFSHYGVPQYIAGMNVSAIAYKTDKWNISRLDNSYQLSGVMVLAGSVDSEEEAKQIVETAEKKFAGKPGQVMFMVKDSEGAEGSKFIPVTSQNEGDWKDLHDQAISDIVVAHSWFRSLSGLDYSNGFTADRILNEYEIALNTVILPEQAELMEPVRRVIERVAGYDTSALQIINRPPVTQRQPYMYIWEARKADGLDYDPEDPWQKGPLATIDKV